jgi:hypothetical protein
MASDHIYVPPTAGDLASDFSRFVDDLTRVVNNGFAIEKVMKRFSKGNDWTSPKEALGVSDDARAQAVQGLLVAANNVLKHNDLNELIERCG